MTKRVKTHPFRQLLIAVLLITCPPMAEGKGRLVIPVFYATDRQLNLDETGNLDYTLEQVQGDRLNYGLKNVVVPEGPMEKEDPERINGLGWWYIVGEVGDSRPLLKNTTLTEAELLQQVGNLVNTGPATRPLVVYVHGCCIPYWKSMEAASQVARTFEAPVLLFAWAAVPPTETKYRLNEDREHVGEERFIRLMSALEAVVPAERVVLVAHSMGNRLIYQMLKNRYYGHGSNPAYPKFGSVAFACADVNLNDFAHDESKVAFNASQTWVTKNDTDGALLLSSIQRGLYDRLGRPLWAVKSLINTDGVDVLDIEPVYRGKHDLPLSVLRQAVRRSENGFQEEYDFRQEKHHLLKVRKR